MTDNATPQPNPDPTADRSVDPSVDPSVDDITSMRPRRSLMLILLAAWAVWMTVLVVMNLAAKV